MACCIMFAWHTWRERDFFVLCMRFVEWVFDGDHLEVGLLVAMIVCWIMLTICIYVEGGAV